nr:MAG TPA: hypothetical protein [Caudoviricetes sp.]
MDRSETLIPPDVACRPSLKQVNYNHALRRAYMAFYYYYSAVTDSWSVTFQED